ncbi:phosphatase PAP2 family protein [Modestobacter sp. Leaf380]|uniref:phosphatase PAP2 family protein n=1 Tax=Modestobacter sp. Leaf380 TaxID=1736356 RepID=UPI0006F65DE3|nr:phosphatase PAP2 family protein [Modestobacter sp. Leaf380]KQS63548.1 phosphoesterase PA-phosphatase [Modestobacter sp. Leaf380]
MTATAVGTPAVPAPAAGLPDRGRALRAVLSTAHLGALLVVVAWQGLPTDRLSVLLWVLAGLACRCAGRGRRAAVRLLADWVPLGAVLLLYDASRGIADGLGAPVHLTEPAAVDTALFGVVPTVWLQAHLTAPGWLAVAVTLVYASHFVLTPLVLAVLWLRDRARWARYARTVVGLSVAGLVTYVLYPAAPPWLAAREGVIGEVARRSGDGWAELGLPRAGALLHAGQGAVNPVAAVPSLHTAFAVLVCLVGWSWARRRWQRVLLVAYALAMPVALVWSGEHYVVDTLLGAAYAVAVWRAVPVLEGVASGVQRRRSLLGASVTPTTLRG